MSVDSIEKLFVEELKDLYSAENQITKALPKMVKAATEPELKKAFESPSARLRGRFSDLRRFAASWAQVQEAKLATG